MRRNDRPEKPLPPVASRVLRWADHRLRSCASALSQLTLHWSRRKVTLALGCFCLVASLASILVVIGAFHGQPVLPARLSAPHLRTLPLPHAPVRPGQEQLRIQRFRRYMDSLSATTAGRELKDRLLAHHPHLMDSIHQLENLYDDSTTQK